MSYPMSQISNKFFIPKENIQKVIEVLKTKDPQCSWGDRKYEDCQTIQEIFEYWGWYIGVAFSGNVVEIAFQGDSLGNEDVLFRAIAPFVKDGSFIHMKGDGAEYEQWKWIFKNGEMKQVFAEITVTFPEE